MTNIKQVYNCYPFGSLMPDRNFSSNSYRFGFNGQMKDDEIFGSTGTSYTAQFWQYDSRTGRRWNLDPKPNPSVSYYATFAGNPIWFSDVLGDTLRIGGDIEYSLCDVRSIVGEQYQSLITVTSDNKIVIDISKTTEEDMNNDAGLLLVKNLVSSNLNYLYEVKKDNNEKSLSSANGTIENNSIEPMFENSQYGDDLPRNIQGQVIIFPDAYFIATNGQEENRASIVFHELEENYERTEHGLKYLYRDPKNPSREDPNRKGAHKIAIDKSKKLAPNVKSVAGAEGELHDAQKNR